MSEVELPEAEVVESETEYLTASALAQKTASEINQMVATAKQFPRNLAAVRKRAYHLIVSSEDVASSCSFAVPRDGMVVRGPSVRFAEIMIHAWGNCRSASRIVDEGNDYITAEGMFYDVESNVATSCEVRARTVDRQGRRYSPDMMVNTANATGAKAARTAALRGIPRAAWQWLYEQAQATVAGDVKTLAERRDKAMQLFKPFGMTPAMLCRVLGIEGVSEITTDHLTSLQAMLTALKDKETTVEELLSATQDQAVADKGARTVEGIKRKYQKPEMKPATTEQIKQAQEKLEEKRRQSKAEEPQKAAEVIEAGKQAEDPF